MTPRAIPNPRVRFDKYFIFIFVSAEVTRYNVERSNTHCSMSCIKNPTLLELPEKKKRSRRKHLYTPTQSIIYQNLLFPVKREIPVSAVLPVHRAEETAPEIALRISQVTIIDLEIGKTLEQRRQAYREENHPSREINQVVIGRALNRDIFKNKISDAETVVLDSESETEKMSE